jgi:hypothetical protein
MTEVAPAAASLVSCPGAQWLPPQKPIAVIPAARAA